ncbi:type III-B CRISPR module-associated Cmr3 family protein [Desnuesiella massiliensis]|uniref:type III-B CRISPR module-associated Cmr3 family protein n=1 Tax=Desnuesiella massiliensis TaxID=1650662 RepID=UPI0006E3D212|nr:type III-B CRISPR module-associated Cmr3 family protein [Desnuesiella massiliensis]
MKLLKIKPYDNTFFRLGNNFEMRISTVIQSKNIAYPSTFFGAIFTAILANNDVFREKFLSKKANNDHFKILSIKQIYLYDEKQRTAYISAPKDLFIGNNISYGSFKRLEENEASILYSSYLEEPEGDELERTDNYYVNIKDFFPKYRYKILQKRDLKHENDIFIKNLKTGIALDKGTGTVRESCIYTIEQTEFKDSEENHWNFVVEYDINNDFVREYYDNIEIKNLDKGHLKLGGESKVCSYEIIDNKSIASFRLEQRDEILKPEEKVKVVLTSDSYFKECLEKSFNDEIKIQALVNDKPIYIGGFDLVKNKEKVMYKGYSAGTVILLQNTSNNDVNINEYLSKKITADFTNGFNQYIYVKGE